jgi:DNA helicase-2/ATP-dependent DNA helicase PcrA
MTWDTGLAGVHLEIAQSAAARLRVMAGPGTGKTFAMKRRIAKLIEVDGVVPRRILAVTFTRTAAGDLKRELHAMDVPDCEEIHAGTLHAFCFHLLLSNEVFDFAGRVPRGLLSFNRSGIHRFEIEPLLHDVRRMGAFGSMRDMSKRIRAFEADWSRLQHEQPGWPTAPLDQAFHQALIRWLQFHRGMLIGELVPEALRFVRNNPASPALQWYDHIVVDEYQDLNRAEQELIDLLSNGRNLAIVGDVDQSIYRFRYAHPEGIQDFSNRHDNVEDKTLAECRRCRAEIVDVADNVILQNYPPGTSHRLLALPQQPGAATVRVVQWPTIEREADGIAAFVTHAVQQRGIPAGEILILSPRRLIANEIKARLANAGISAHSFYNDKLLDPEEAQLAMTKLQLLVNGNDRVALRYWLGHGSPSWRAGQYSRMRAHCEVDGADPRQVLEASAAGQIQVGGIGQLIGRYGDWQGEFEQLVNLNVNDLLDALFPAGQEWADPIRELLTGKIDTVEDGGGLLDLIRNEITQPEMPTEGDFVRLMSLHKSKGLTSTVTVIAGCIHGLIPFVDDDLPIAEQDLQTQEQRRLFYVALTRAREIVVLSSFVHLPRDFAHRIRVPVGGGHPQIGRTFACQFLNELGPQVPQALAGQVWMNAGFQ